MSGGTIVVVSPYRTEYGPPQTLEHVCRSLSDAGYHPIAAVPDGARITENLAALGTPIRTLGSLTTFPRTYDPLRLARFFRNHQATVREIGRVARGEKAVAVYSISEATYAGSLAARGLGLPSAVHVIGMSIQSPRVAANTYVRFLGGITDQFIACSAAVAEMLIELGAASSRVSVVHNGISVAAVQAGAALPTPVAHKGARIGMVAAYDRRKGHELFLRAAARLAPIYSDARFYLIGGTLGDHLESRAFERRIASLIESLNLTDRVELVGYVGQPEVYAWLAAMDVVVVPSRTEAFAHALLEAMACERPVVATAIEGNLDAFADGHSGLYAERSPEPVVAAVRRLLDNPDLAARMGLAARERVERYFDVSVTLPALAQTVGELLRSHAAKAASA